MSNSTPAPTLDPIAVLAKAATTVVRTDAPQRAQISKKATRAFAAEYQGKSSTQILSSLSLTPEQVVAYAKGECRMSALPDAAKVALKATVESLRVSAGLKATDAREVAALIVAQSSSRAASKAKRAPKPATTPKG